MTNERLICSCYCDRSKSLIVTHFFSSFLLIFLFCLPSGYAHISSVLEDDILPGIPVKPVPRGPTVAPVPSPETLDKLEQIANNKEYDTYFNPAEAIRNLLSLSSTSKRLQGLKRVSRFRGDGEIGLLGTGSGTFYRPVQSFQKTWDYDEDAMSHLDGEEKPTFVPFIGARALTNIPQFFEHLKENIEALKLSHHIKDEDEEDDDEDDDIGNEDGLESNLDGFKDITKPAARRMKTELLVDEKLGHTSSDNKPESGSRQNWKPRAAGVIHYYAPKTPYLESQQNILRRANNYNPAWLYTNLGLGKRRRRR